MAVYSVITIIAITWLLYRLVQLLSIPVSAFVEALNIDMSCITKVTIDRITPNSISIRWDNESFRNNKNPITSHYTVFLNGRKIGSFPDSPRSLFTCCSIKNLKPLNRYTVDIIAVRKDGFVNKLPPLHIMTCSEEFPAVQECGIEQLRQLDSRTDTNPVIGSLPSNKGDSFKWEPLKLKSSTSVLNKGLASAYSSYTTLEDLNELTIEDLKDIFAYAQNDLQDVLKQRDYVALDLQTARTELQSQLQSLKSRWNDESEVRKSLKATLKSLENNKVNNDLKKDKLMKNIETVSNRLKRMKAEMEQWELELQEKLDSGNLLRNYLSDREQLSESINSSKERLRNIQKDIATIDHRTKELISSRKAWKTINDEHQGSAIPLMKRLSDSKFFLAGNLTKELEKALKLLPQDSPLAIFLAEELGKDRTIESDWESKKAQFTERIGFLIALRDNTILRYKQYRNSLTAQPYHPLSTSIAERTSSPETPMQMIVAPQLVLHDPSTYPETDKLSQVPTQPVINHFAQPAASEYTSWNHQWTAFEQDSIEEDAAFEQDDTNHLLSGLQSIISDSDYQNGVSTFKTFTTDELDNYWKQTATHEDSHHNDHGFIYNQTINGKKNFSQTRFVVPQVTDISPSTSLSSSSVISPVQQLSNLKPEDSSLDQMKIHRAASADNSLLQQPGYDLNAAPVATGVPGLTGTTGAPSNPRIQRERSNSSLLPVAVAELPSSSEPRFFSPNFGIWYESNNASTQSLGQKQTPRPPIEASGKTLEHSQQPWTANFKHHPHTYNDIVEVAGKPNHNA
ncbi:HEL109Cp [Eremothecium sinecaudum]|uniref:HEL109Cp n=1 Tax=Eremothecium sinecaudum TaxID=45286 RepID=A0A0X8HTH6_9SACH|nr:HEL109Cp [Eremothecium sinecaudum]AMD21171.1 HEL109Cp [Eremothecium sinecaudum]